MVNTILRDAVERRRAEFPEQSKFLTDWQVHSANLVMSAISMKALGTGLDEGARYLPFPTGSGKTVGAALSDKTRLRRAGWSRSLSV